MSSPFTHGNGVISSQLDFWSSCWMAKRHSFAHNSETWELEISSLCRSFIFLISAVNNITDESILTRNIVLDLSFKEQEFGDQISSSASPIHKVKSSFSWASIRKHCLQLREKEKQTKTIMWFKHKNLDSFQKSKMWWTTLLLSPNLKILFHGTKSAISYFFQYDRSI